MALKGLLHSVGNRHLCTEILNNSDVWLTVGLDPAERLLVGMAMKRWPPLARARVLARYREYPYHLDTDRFDKEFLGVLAKEIWPGMTHTYVTGEPVHRLDLRVDGDENVRISVTSEDCRVLARAAAKSEHIKKKRHERKQHGASVVEETAPVVATDVQIDESDDITSVMASALLDLQRGHISTVPQRRAVTQPGYEELVPSLRYVTCNTCTMRINGTAIDNLIRWHGNADEYKRLCDLKPVLRQARIELLMPCTTSGKYVCPTCEPKVSDAWARRREVRTEVRNILLNALEQERGELFEKFESVHLPAVYLNTFTVPAALALVAYLRASDDAVKRAVEAARAYCDANGHSVKDSKNQPKKDVTIDDLVVGTPGPRRCLRAWTVSFEVRLCSRVVAPLTRYGCAQSVCKEAKVDPTTVATVALYSAKYEEFYALVPTPDLEAKVCADATEELEAHLGEVPFRGRHGGAAGAVLASNDILRGVNAAVHGGDTTHLVLPPKHWHHKNGTHIYVAPKDNRKWKRRKMCGIALWLSGAQCSCSR